MCILLWRTRRDETMRSVCTFHSLSGLFFVFLDFDCLYFEILVGFRWGSITELSLIIWTVELEEEEGTVGVLYVLFEKLDMA